MDCLQLEMSFEMLNFATGCSLNIDFFPKILEIFPPLPRQHSAVVGCTKIDQPIGVTVHSHCLESFEVSYSDVGEGGVAVNCKKHFFLNTLYMLACLLLPFPAILPQDLSLFVKVRISKLMRNFATDFGALILLK